jgi:hypothetical protein
MAAVLNQWFFRRHLDDDEKILLVVHKHWLWGIRALLWPTLAVVADLALWYLLKSRAWSLTVFGVLGFVAVLWWLRSFYDYFLDAWIITNEGVIDVDWHGFFHRESSRVLYSDIQGVSYEIKGIVATLLRVGTMEIEKISTGGSIKLERVARLKKVEGTILKSMEHYMHKKNMRDASQVKDLLATLVAEQINMKAMDPAFKKHAK